MLRERRLLLLVRRQVPPLRRFPVMPVGSRREAEPHVCQNVIARHALAEQALQSETVTSPGVALPGGALDRFGFAAAKLSWPRFRERKSCTGSCR